MTPTFPEFFEAVWGYGPYPWQVRLAQRVESEGWPDVLDLPTGSGKTAVLDIALHQLVRDRGRSAPRRIVLVVDRRVIVNQVAERAGWLRDRIVHGSGVLAAVREALQQIVGGRGPLLDCPTLRGGIVQSDDWARYPHVPVLAASTVDQIGSRLLFRGYGVTDSMRPVHAGLLGCDTLLLLDEVHLSRPFAETLCQLQALRSGESLVPHGMGVVQLSATPGTGVRSASMPFELDESDHETPALAAILTARKPTTLEEVRTRASAPEPDKREALAARAAELAIELAGEGRTTVLVVVNRVDTARRVWRHLSSNEVVDSTLITGRMRPLDQQGVIERISPRVMADRNRSDAEQLPLIVVATQCVEAGADYDFDGLVTECASLDSLRQRFGRLDRRGTCTGRIGCTARAVVLARSDIKSMSAPVYGSALLNTWQWLQEIAVGGEVDFGIGGLQLHVDGLGERMEELVVKPREAPVTLPTYLDQWSQTNPRPHADPDVSLFLHGIPKEGENVLPDIQVVWRADVTKIDLETVTKEGADSARWEVLREQLSAVPPGTLEAISLPVWVVRDWLSERRSSEADADLADVEGVGSAQPAVGGGSQLVVLWRGADDSAVREARRVPPGSLIVVPANRGGIGAHGTFDPGAADPVEDIGDIVQLRQRGRGTLRLDERVWPALASISQRVEESRTDDFRDIEDLIRDALVDLTQEEGLDPRLQKLATSVATDSVIRELGEGGWLVMARRRAQDRRSGPETGFSQGGGEADDESFVGLSSVLSEHLNGVAEWAGFFARRVGLPHGLVASLRWAALLHDVGKVDPRFQILLYGGDEISARFGEPLAKSRTPWQDRPARRRARELAGYPEGQRHELVSLDMIEGAAPVEEAVRAEGADWQLVLHLVASHHGWCRPLAPPMLLPEDDADSVSWSVAEHRIEGSTDHGRGQLNSGVSRRFIALIREYGWHELAYLETILRLADHRRSEQEDQR